MSSENSSGIELKFGKKRLSLSADPLSAPLEILHRPGGWAILISKNADGTQNRERVVATKFKQGSGKQVLHAQVRGSVIFAEWIEKDPSQGAGASAAGDQDLVAQFPGKVRKLMVGAGDQVKEGQKLLLVDAMKMEFSILAPYGGKVTQILVTEGQQLSPGDRFLEIEPETEGQK